MEGNDKYNLEVAIGKLKGVTGILCSLSVTPEGIVKNSCWSLGLLEGAIDEAIELLENTLNDN